MSIAVSPGKDLEKRDGVIDLMEQGGFPAVAASCIAARRSARRSSRASGGAPATVRSGDR
eukprot:scaffold232047_cov22-Attheya_sp.AAC.1